MDDNKNKPMGWPLLYTLATLAGVAMLAILKACDVISMSWPVVIAGLVWVPTALLLITLWVAALLIWIGRTGKKIREYNRRRKISRTLDESMKGLTLNGVGPIYGIRRNKGENNTDYEKRIREKLGFSPRSLPKYETMEQLTLSNVGPIYGVVKKQDESWKHYRRRILKAAQTIDTVQLPTGKCAPGDRRTEGKKRAGQAKRPAPAHGCRGSALKSGTQRAATCTTRSRARSQRRISKPGRARIATGLSK